MAELPGSELSRRNLLVGVAAIGATLALPSTSHAQIGDRGEVLTDGWEPVAPRSHHTMTPLANGWLLVAGGFIGGRPTSSAMIVDPSSGLSRPVAAMLCARARHATAVLPDGRLLILGGYNVEPLRSVEAYDISTDRWVAMPPLDTPRADFCAAVVGDRIVLFGGSSQASVLSYGHYLLGVANAA